MTTKIEDLKSFPFWWEDTALRDQGDDALAALPREADVVVVGAGLSGLAAARTLANAGRSVVVLDAGRPGAGASSRNGAMLGRYLKHSFGQMKTDLGLDVAVRYFRELDTIYKRAVDRIQGLGHDSGFRNCGRVVGAITTAHRDRLFREWELRNRYVGEAVDFINAPDDPELPTGRYVGAVHIIENAALHPGRYTLAMLQAAREAGALVIGKTPVVKITRPGGVHLVMTPRGSINARDVLVATNGYTGRTQAEFHRRLSPIDAFMIATEPLPESLRARLPKLDRTYHDNRKNSNYFQMSDDGRLIFGGRTGLIHRSSADIASKLRQEMLHFFPQLDEVAITHAWRGTCAATNDLLPHVGCHNGVHFAIGYCFSGLAMAPYLGEKAAATILGDHQGADTLFQQDDLGVVAWPKRQRWLIPVAMQYFRMQEPLRR